jgi:hypothetical protein
MMETIFWWMIGAILIVGAIAMFTAAESIKAALLEAQEQENLAWNEYRIAARANGLCPYCELPSRLCKCHAVYAVA